MKRSKVKPKSKFIKQKSSFTTGEIVSNTPYLWMLMGGAILIGAVLFASLRVVDYGETLAWVVSTSATLFSILIPYFVAPGPRVVRTRLRATLLVGWIPSITMGLFLVALSPLLKANWLAALLGLTVLFVVNVAAFSEVKAIRDVPIEPYIMMVQDGHLRLYRVRAEEPLFISTPKSKLTVKLAGSHMSNNRRPEVEVLTSSGEKTVLLPGGWVKLDKAVTLIMGVDLAREHQQIVPDDMPVISAEKGSDPVRILDQSRAPIKVQRPAILNRRLILGFISHLDEIIAEAITRKNEIGSIVSKSTLSA